jgi:hypothetical protein
LTRGQDEYGDDGGHNENDGLYMRDVGRRSIAKVDVTSENGETGKEMIKAKKEEKEKEVAKKPIAIGRKEAKRLALIELHTRTFR